MKNHVKYSELWSKKRAELPVNADVQADWPGMQSLLDQHLPVSPGAAVKKPPFKGFEFLPTLLVALSAAAMIYLASQFYTHEKHRHTAKHALKPGRLSNDSNQEALTVSPGGPGNKDSAAAANKPGAKSDSAAVKSPSGRNSPVSLKDQSRPGADSLALVNGRPQATGDKSAGRYANKFKGSSAGSFTLIHGAGPNSNNSGGNKKRWTGKPKLASLNRGVATPGNGPGASSGSHLEPAKVSDQSAGLPVLAATTPAFGLDADYLRTFSPINA